jgi:hypothetical protein
VAVDFDEKAVEMNTDITQKLGEVSEDPPFAVSSIYWALTAFLFFGMLAIHSFTGIFSLLVPPLLGVGAYWLATKRGKWFLICLLFACGHFAYLNPRGGLWNLIAFFAFSLLFFRRNSKSGQPSYALERVTVILVVMLTILNFGGLIFKNTYGWDFRILGAFSFLGCVYLFRHTMTSNLTPVRISGLLKIWGVVNLYMLFAAINQRFILVPYDLPFLPLRTDEFGESYGTTNNSSTFGVGELFGEYQAISFCVFWMLAYNRKVMKQLSLSSIYVHLICLACALNVVLANSRSGFILMVIFVLFMLLSGFIGLFGLTPIAMRKLLLLVSVWGILSVFGDALNFENLQYDFNKTISQELTVANILNGQAINRGLPFEMGWGRLFEENWTIGYGFGTGYSNLYAWTGSFDGYSPYFNAVVVDSHSLYLSIVPIFGWLGSVLFIFIFLVTMFRLGYTVVCHHHSAHFLLPICVGLFFGWFIFLVDEYKINALRCNNYLLIIWFFLGLSHAVCREISNQVRTLPRGG